MATDTARVFALAPSALQGIPLCAATAVNWIAVANGLAGRFRAAEVATDVASRVGPSMTVYQTTPDPCTRREELVDLIHEQHPSERNSLRVLVFGGDGTINDVVGAVLAHLFPETNDLTERPPTYLTERMLNSGISIGAIQLGGANDIGSLYGVAQTVEDTLQYMSNARMMALNMGLSILLTENRTSLFCHNSSAGNTIALIYEKTLEERGLRARRHRQRIGLAHNLLPQPVRVKWQAMDGSSEDRTVLEILAHATVRADGMNGFPGTPQPGIGIKILPASGFWKTLKVFSELVARGRSSLKGDPRRLLPTQRLDNLDPMLQLSLMPGEETNFSFHAGDGAAITVPVQGNGDYVGRTHRLRIRALPPFPYFMGREESLMAHLQECLAAAEERQS